MSGKLPDGIDGPGFDWRDAPNPKPPAPRRKVPVYVLPALMFKAWRLRRRIRRLEGKGRSRDE